MSKKNKIKMVAKGLTGVTAGLLISQSIYAANPFSTVAQKFKNIFSTGEAKVFSAADIKQAASAEFEVKSARLITDNDEAFQSKLAMVQSAKESIKMIYFIYSDDYSSSLFTQEVIKAAQRGVKVELLVDFLTNYKMMDLFTLMEREGKDANGTQKLFVRFYGKPTDKIIDDLNYMSRSCPTVANPSATQCYDYKMSAIKNEKQKLGQRTNTLTATLLSGIYGKSPAAIKAALLAGGNLIDLLPKKTEGAASTGSVVNDDMKEFLELVYDAEVKKEVSAMIKLQMALMLKPEIVNPALNQVYGILPFHKSTSAEDWMHISDYTHHKMILVDGYKLLMGGRNIEDSYHIKPSDQLPLKKYIFMDTDFAAELTEPNAKLVKSFDNMFSFTQFVATTTEIATKMPVGLAVNSEAVNDQAGKCLSTTKGYSDRAACMSQVVANPKWVNEVSRQNAILASMSGKIAKYQQYFAANQPDTSWTGTIDDRLSTVDVKTAKVAYFENLAFKKDDEDKQRHFGAPIGKELQYNKNIHVALLRSLENACAVGAKTKQVQEVYFHNAYFMPASNMMITFAKMLDGTWDCSNVKVNFLTNSFQTTDLNLINLLSKYEMTAFYHILATKQGHFGDASAKAAQFRYYEYKPVTNPSLGANSQMSLHTKLSLIGNNFIIGSANLDVRSYYMDTNNVVMIQNANELNKKYAKYMQSILADTSRVEEVTGLYSTARLKSANPNELTLEKLDKLFIDGFLARFDKKGHINDNNKIRAQEVVTAIGHSIYNDTKVLIDKAYVPTWAGEDEQEKTRQQINEQVDKANRFNKFFQVF